MPHIPLGQVGHPGCMPATEQARRLSDFGLCKARGSSDFALGVLPAELLLNISLLCPSALPNLVASSAWLRATLLSEFALKKSVCLHEADVSPALAELLARHGRSLETIHFADDLYGSPLCIVVLDDFTKTCSFTVDQDGLTDVDSSTLALLVAPFIRWRSQGDEFTVRANRGLLTRLGLARFDVIVHTAHSMEQGMLCFTPLGIDMQAHPDLTLGQAMTLGHRWMEDASALPAELREIAYILLAGMLPLPAELATEPTADARPLGIELCLTGCSYSCGEALAAAERRRGAIIFHPKDDNVARHRGYDRPMQHDVLHPTPDALRALKAARRRHPPVTQRRDKWPKWPVPLGSRELYVLDANLFSILHYCVGVVALLIWSAWVWARSRDTRGGTVELAASGDALQ